MRSIKKILGKGVHTLALPINDVTPIEALFPKELSGSFIEKLDKSGSWTKKEIVLFENNSFIVNANYAHFNPLDTVRLTLKRDIIIDWYISFESHTGLKQANLNFQTGFDFDEALYLAQLSKLVYAKEDVIKETISTQYEFDEHFYYSQNNHGRLVKRGFSKMLFTFLRGRMSIVDLQFMYLRKHDEKSGKDLIVVVFQGSQEPHDWLTNFSFKDTDFHHRGKVHQGFYHSLKLFFQTMRKKNIKFKHKLTDTPFSNIEAFNANSNIIITGHSLGGAIASLAACYLLEIGVNSENIEVYSFGAPPVGTEEFCDFYSNKINLYRLVNENDVVPKLDKITNLFHFGNEIMLDSNEGEIHACDGYIDNIIDSLQLRISEQ